MGNKVKRNLTGEYIDWQYTTAEYWFTVIFIILISLTIIIIAMHTINDSASIQQQVTQAHCCNNNQCNNTIFISERNICRLTLTYLEYPAANITALRWWRMNNLVCFNCGGSLNGKRYKLNRNVILCLACRTYGKNKDKKNQWYNR